ncbi:MAG: disulfide bond formation protein B [Deltaproteobacteria bacterium]|jgi:disulfide bond formation protein DsbB|nr:disulfide bond formation protein B [Deltaproteobacteria bacterium]
MFGPLKKLLDDFFGALKDYANHRPMWLLGAVTAIAIELFSVGFFQKYLGLRPCEYCVVIRFDTLVVALGGLIAFIKPSSWFIRIPGLVVSFYGAIAGLLNTLALEAIYLKSQYLPGYITVCRAGQMRFPFKLRPDKWFPFHFSPEAICGEDPVWSFLGFTMTQWLIIIFIFMLIALTLAFIAPFVNTRPKLAENTSLD